MFPLLRRQWTPVIPLVELTANPVGVEVAGERVVLFRDHRDTWHALLDRCPHRGAALSLGAVTDEGTLRCRYHGWRFGGDGSCQRVPLNELSPPALRKIRASSLPTRELAGALWIYTGLDADNDLPDPSVPDSLKGPPREYGTYSQHWTAHWTRAVENFIDFAHPPYLHQATIGAWTHDIAEGGATAQVDVYPTAWGFETLNYLGQRRQGFRVDWYRPNLSVLHFGGGPVGKLHVFAIPVSGTQTRVMTVRRLPAGADTALFAARAGNVDHTILDEDRVIVESQSGPVDDTREISVATDAPAAAFRRWHKEMLEGSRGKALQKAPAPDPA